MAAEPAIAGRTSRDIADSVESAIERGELTPGQPLPSVRGLAAGLGVSPSTVSAAYRDLRLRGVVTSEAGRATRVGVRSAPQARQFGRVAAGVRDLSDGNPAPDLLPDPRTALSRMSVPRFRYGDPTVLPELAAVAEEQFDDVPASVRAGAGPIGVVGGAMDGVERVLGSRARPNDRVAVEDPGYPGVLELVRAMGMVPVGVAVDDDGPVTASLAAALETRVAAFVVTPRAQNPTGAAVSARRARDLRRLLDRHPEVLVIEDDHASLIAGAAYVAVAAGRRAWAIVRTTSKVLGPDLRVGFLLADQRTSRRVAERQLVGAGWVSHVLQRLVVELWSDDGVRSATRSAAQVYRERREGLLTALGERGVVARGRSGLNVCVPVAHEIAVVQRLQELGWAVRAGEPHRLRSDPFVRITTSTLGAEEARRLAGDLAAVLAPSRLTQLA